MTPLVIYFDTEFTQLPGPDGRWSADLISAGFVTEAGDTWYAERRDADFHACSDFVRQTVLPQLDAPLAMRLNRAEFGARLFDWLTGFDRPITLVSDWPGDWDLVYRHLEDLFLHYDRPIMHSLWYCPPELVAGLENLGLMFWHDQKHKPHHALADAHWLKARATYVRQAVEVGRA